MFLFVVGGGHKCFSELDRSCLLSGRSDICPNSAVDSQQSMKDCTQGRDSIIAEKTSCYTFQLLQCRRMKQFAWIYPSPLKKDRSFIAHWDDHVVTSWNPTASAKMFAVLITYPEILPALFLQAPAVSNPPAVDFLRLRRSAKYNIFRRNS